MAKDTLKTKCEIFKANFYLFTTIDFGICDSTNTIPALIVDSAKNIGTSLSERLDEKFKDAFDNFFDPSLEDAQVGEEIAAAIIADNQTAHEDFNTVNAEVQTVLNNLGFEYEAPVLESIDSADQPTTSPDSIEPSTQSVEPAPVSPTSFATPTENTTNNVTQTQVPKPYNKNRDGVAFF